MCPVYFRIEWEFALRRPLRAKPNSYCETAWNDTAEVKGCDSNWYRIERPYSMRQCLENGKALHWPLE